MDGARERLDIMNPYLTDPDMIQRITHGRAWYRRSGRRLGKLEQLGGHDDLATPLRRHDRRRQRELGVSRSGLHAKLIVADDRVQFGTLDCDAWALYRNLEIAIVADSPVLADLMDERGFTPGRRPVRPRRTTDRHRRRKIVALRQDRLRSLTASDLGLSEFDVLVPVFELC